ncbi:class I SAM-dependent methyltransferase [uncultured Tateyamaria sp.]|uniref:class I SAM-dependent methyltransferase n=1 Tax=uncultured Tateyamaria sp. TaxID=455651 RepID=UPI00262567F7|nr:class I SAM-dependent methyltransferase [uncultured Tateyamaria sp.]
MTPEEQAAFFTVHSDLPREGPGLPDDVYWAVEHLGLSGTLRVLDAGCGPGADLEVLARALPEARIEGIDKVPHFVQAAQTRVAAYAPRVTAELRDMAELDGTYDLIWCAGALYFLGVTAGLKRWRDALNRGGMVAFSEPVLVTTPASAEATAFWEEYPQITDLEGIKAQVADAGYEVQAHRMIVGAPWRAYFDPMQARMDMLRKLDPDAALAVALEENQLEIDRWAAVPEQIAYALLIVTPR